MDETSDPRSGKKTAPAEYTEDDAMQWYAKVMRQYVDFHGRAHRTEYWMFVLCNAVIAGALFGLAAGINAVTGSQTPVTIGFITVALYYLSVTPPMLAVPPTPRHRTLRPVAVVGIRPCHRLDRGTGDVRVLRS